MKAIVYTEYGPPEVLRIDEMDVPDPKDNEIRVKVYATSINYGDIIARKFNSIRAGEFNMIFLFWLIAKISFGLKKPRNPILGSEFSGEVDATGKDVQQFKTGDKVFGYLGQSMR